MGPGATVGVLGTGVPRLACLRPTTWLSGGLVQPVFINPSSRPSRGPNLAVQTAQGFLKGGLTRQAREEAERSRQEVPREVLVMQAMTIKTKRVPGGRQPAQCPRFLFGAKGASAGAEYRGIKQRFPYQCNKTKTSRAAGRRSPWSPRQRHHQCLWQSKTTFSQDSLY